jgi:drug/metabolite transporter (DMT)-like permease
MKPGFLVYSVFVVGVIVWLLLKVVPVHGSSQPIVYLSITSLGGAFVVNAAQGLGSSIVYSMRHWEDDNQFFNWKLYPLGVFVGVAAVFQILYLNKSLQYFSTSIVTPVNYVFFSTATLVTSAVLYEGFNVTSFINGATIVLGFAVIVIGVALLFQYNLKLNKLAQKLAEKNLLKNEAPKADVVAALEKAINEPSSDQNPFTLMIQTFPIRPGRSPHSTSERPSRSQSASEVPDFKDTSNLTVTSMVLPNRTESPEVDPKLSGTL